MKKLKLYEVLINIKANFYGVIQISSTPFKFMISLKVLISSDFVNMIKQNVSTDLIIFWNTPHYPNLILKEY